MSIVRELFAKLGLVVDKGSFTAADVLLAGAKAGLVAVAGLGLAAGVGVAALVHGLVETTGQLNDMSQSVGVSTDALQELGFAAQLNGSDLDSMRLGLTLLSKHLVSAGEGNKEAGETFGKLGLRVRDASGKLKSADAVFGEIGDKFAKLPDGPKKTALALDLFGKSGAQLIPTLNQGGAELSKLRQEARDLGIVISKETIVAGDDLGDNLDKLKAGVRGLGFAIAGPLLTPLNEATLAAIEWIKANRAAIALNVQKVYKAIGDAAKSLLVVLRSMARVLGFLADNWRLLAVILSSAVLTAILANIPALIALAFRFEQAGIAAVIAGLRAAAAWVAAAAGPIAIAALIAIAILIVDDLITALQGGESLLARLWPKWLAFVDDFIFGDSTQDSWITKAFKGLLFFAFHFPEVWRDAVDGTKAIFSDLASWITGLYDSVIDGVTGKISSSFQSIKNFLHIGDSGVSATLGGGSSPAASVASSTARGGGSVQTSTQNQFTILQQPGESGDALSKRVAQQVAQSQQTQLEEAMAAL